MKVIVEDIKEILNTVKLGISPAENIDQSNHFIFQDGKVYAFNNEIIVIKEQPMDIEGAVIAFEFLESLNKFKTDKISVKQKDNMFVMHSSKKDRKTTTGVSFTPDITLPLEEVGDIDSLEWKKISKDFSEALQLVSPNVSRDGSTGILQCIHVKKGIMEATDNYNIVRFNLDKKMKEFCIYGPNAYKISRFSFVSYCVQENWVFFKTKDETIVGTRNFSDTEFPDTIHFFKNFTGKKVSLPAELKNSLSKAQIFIDANSEDLVELEIKDGWAKLKATGPAGFITEKIKVKGKVKSFSIEVSLPQLLYLINHSADIEFGDSVARIESKKSTYICALR